jgi:hypothetical protein
MKIPSTRARPFSVALPSTSNLLFAPVSGAMIYLAYYRKNM